MHHHCCHESPIKLIGDTLYQWDLGREVEVRLDTPFVEFVVDRTNGTAIIVQTQFKYGTRIAEIPNFLLQDGNDIICFMSSGKCTLEKKILPVVRRARPCCYNYKATEVETIEDLKQWVLDELMEFEAQFQHLSYNDLEDKPSIEGVTLVGDLTFEDLGATAVITPLEESEIEDLFK